MAAALLPALLAVVVMIPRLASPQFGLFDDGVTLVTVRQLLAGGGQLWEFGLGRFRPTYWLYWIAMELLADGSPLIYFLGNLVLLGVSGVFIVLLLLSLHSTPRAAALAGSAFVLSGPIIENYYTLSKAEPIQLLLLLASLAVLLSGDKAEVRFPGLGRASLTVLLLMLAMGSKETTIVIAPLAAVWLLGAWLASRRRNATAHLALPATFLTAALLASAAYVMIRTLAFGIPLYGAGYVSRYSLAAADLLPSAVRWLAWTIRFFPYLLPMILLAPLIWWRRRDRNGSALIFLSGAWMLAWLAIVVPWTVSAGYFLLPLGAGVAVFSAVVADHALPLLREDIGAVRVAVGMGLLTAAGLFAIVLINNSSIARLQLAVDRANHEAIDLTRSLLPTGARLLVNIQTPNEYLDEIGIHLRDLYGREDLKISGYSQPQDLETSSASDLYVLIPEVENQMGFSVRHGVIEATLQQWNRTLEAVLPAGAELEFHVQENPRLIDIAFLRLACPLGGGLLYCQTSSRIIDVFQFRYGWRMYAID